MYASASLTWVLQEALCSSSFTRLLQQQLYWERYMCIFKSNVWWAFLSVLFVTSHQFHYSFLLLLLTWLLTSFPLTILLETSSSAGPHKHLPDLQKCHLYLRACLWVRNQAPNHFSICLQWLGDADIHPLWATHLKHNVQPHLLLEVPPAWLITT